jgi:phosphatidylinositol glycan class W
MADTAPPSYKQLKEDFVSNLSGGSVNEVNLVISVSPVRVS